jgi:hypothetical protein
MRQEAAMHEAHVKLFEDVLSVVNRALLSGAKPAALFGGANPDEDDGFALRMRGGALEIADHCDPHRDERSREGRTIRLDDLRRIVDEPEHYAANLDLVAKLVSHGPA